MYPLRFRLSALALALASWASVAEAIAPADTTTVAGVRARYAAIAEAYLSGEDDGADDVGADGDGAYVAAKALLAEGLNADDAEVAAEVLFRGVDLSRRLPQRRPYLYALTDSARAYRPRDTSRAARGLFLLAAACVELQRGAQEVVYLLADSSLRVGGASARAHTRASALVIRGYAERGTGRPAAAARSFAAGAALLRELPGERASYFRAAEAYVRSLVALGEHERALGASAEAIAVMEAEAGASAGARSRYNVYLARAESLAALGERDGALAALAKAEAEAARRRGDLAAAHHVTLGAADVYLRLGDPERALVAGDTLVARARRTGSLGDHYGGLRARVEALARMGRYREAFAAEREAAALQDSIHRAAVEWHVEDLRERHAYLEVNQRLVLAQAENAALAANAERARAERRAWIVGAAAVLALALALGARLRRRRRRHGELARLVESRTAEIETQRADLETQARALRESNRELERFAYIASHDLKTPIRNVTSFLGLIERRLAPEARAGVQEYLDLAGGYARQMHALVTDVLEFSRIDADLAASSGRVDVAGLLDKLRRQLEPGFAERGGRLEVSGSGTAFAPPAYLAQLLTNLIENGLKYNRAAVPTVTVSIAARADGTTAVRVTDNGIGIAAEYHERVFEMFKRLHTSDDYQGTGLGLAVCKKVVERLGGTIRLASAPGEGSEFTVVLPGGGPDAVGGAVGRGPRRDAMVASAPE